MPTGNEQCSDPRSQHEQASLPSQQFFGVWGGAFMCTEKGAGVEKLPVLTAVGLCAHKTATSKIRVTHSVDVARVKDLVDVRGQRRPVVGFLQTGDTCQSNWKDQ